MKHEKKGFTLVELLIVVVIIAILVAISIPIFRNNLRKARLAANQANGRAAFSAAEVAYLQNMAQYGTSEANTNSKNRNYNTITYTYFVGAGKGILNFHYSSGDNRWICDKYGKVCTNTNVSSWTVDSELSDGIKIGDYVANIWTIHLNPDDGHIEGYYCAFPSAKDPYYREVLNAFANGTESKYEQK